MSDHELIQIIMEYYDPNNMILRSLGGTAIVPEKIEEEEEEDFKVKKIKNKRLPRNPRITSPIKKKIKTIFF